ncbi:MAG: DUF3842 family protein [Lachnospiraceae bacterium]|nr:DUF3842 family protein [Lachnospiraceae bacterium]
MHILVIDAQGGGIGRQLITQIKAALPDADILAVGTNSSAAAAMLKAGADTVATGENSVVVGARRADVIIGPVGIVIADAMNGEITPKMAAAVGASEARRILIPFNNCYTYIAGVEKTGMAALIADAIRELKETAGK